jgi:O-antigen/teichoic acid export membrane protein
VLAESAASAVFSLFSMLLIGRVIGPEATGIGTVALAAFLLVDVLSAALFTDALVQYRSLARQHSDSAITAAVLVGLVAGLALAASAPLLAEGSGLPQVTWLVLALAPLLPLSAFSGCAAGMLLRAERFRLLSLRVLFCQPLALAAGMAAAFSDLGPWAMIANQAVATVATLLLLLLRGRLSVRPRLNLPALRQLWPVAGPQIAAVAVMMGKYRIFLLSLGLVVAESTVALSHFAFRMLDAVLVMVWASVSRIALPRLCTLQHDREALAEVYGDMAQLQALLGLPLAVGIALTAPDLVSALLGPHWAGTAHAAQIAGLAGAVTFIWGDHTSLFVAVGRARLNLHTAVATLLLPLLALIVLRPSTPSGVAWAWAAQSLLIPPVMFWLVLRELHRSFFWLVRRVAPAVLATAAMAAAVMLMEAELRGQPAGLRLVLCAATGAVVYLAVVALALGGRMPPALARRRRSGPIEAAAE